jgi:methionine aminopeptidase
VDVTVYHRGYHGDLNETFFVGTPKEHVKKLVINTWECLEKAINDVKPGVKFRDVGNVIQKHAQSEGFSVVRSYCGHGRRCKIISGKSLILKFKFKASTNCSTVLPMCRTTPKTRPSA